MFWVLSIDNIYLRSKFVNEIEILEYPNDVKNYNSLNILNIMGLVSIMIFVSIPLTAMLVSSIKLGKLLPVAARQMGNTIGMGYVYFKVIIRNLKPKN